LPVGFPAATSVLFSQRCGQAFGFHTFRVCVCSPASIQLLGNAFHDRPQKTRPASRGVRQKPSRKGRHQAADSLASFEEIGLSKDAGAKQTEDVFVQKKAAGKIARRERFR
jgi:hypothetical protein